MADLTITRDGVAQLDQSGRAGGDRVGRAGKALDQVLQQNAAMVEQTTAATPTLKGDASQWAGLVGQFQLPREDHSEPSRRERA